MYKFQNIQTEYTTFVHTLTQHDYNKYKVKSRGKKGETSKETMINQHSINIRGTKCLR